MTGRHKHRRTRNPLVLRSERVDCTRKIKPGTWGRGIIASLETKGFVEGIFVTRKYLLHATKGYRSFRA